MCLWEPLYSSNTDSIIRTTLWYIASQKLFFQCFDTNGTHYLARLWKINFTWMGCNTITIPSKQFICLTTTFPFRLKYKFAFGGNRAHVFQTLVWCFNHYADCKDQPKSRSNQLMKINRQPWINLDFTLVVNYHSIIFTPKISRSIDISIANRSIDMILSFIECYRLPRIDRSTSRW